MSEFSKKHPKLNAKLMGYVESGMNPDEIIAQFKKDDENALAENKRDATEDFPDEIMLISQALAYREAELEDVNEIYTLLSSSYGSEVTGSESFRSGEVLSKDLIESLVSDPSYKWLLVEAPSGRDIELDGVILGACCFSTDGVSRCNGVVEGSLGSIRLFGVLPRYHGFCVGRRLLKRAEEKMFRDHNCVRVMVCIPSPRVSMLKWVERRNYVKLGASPYPFNALGHVASTKNKVELVQFIKTKASMLNSNDDADGKYGKVLALVSPPTKNEFNSPSTTVVSDTAESFSGGNVSISPNAASGDGSSGVGSESDRSRVMPPAGNPRLPPLWRHLSVSNAMNSGNGAVDGDANVEDSNRGDMATTAEEDLYASDAKVRKNISNSGNNGGAGVSQNRRDEDDELELGVD